jgi:hypothetical protein
MITVLTFVALTLWLNEIRPKSLVVSFARPSRRDCGPCGCACCYGGWCGGCGHAGCGRR